MEFRGHGIPNFEPGEFSEDINLYAHTGLITRLQKQRDLLGARIDPSPVAGALARFGYAARRSKHAAHDRLSTALDWFTSAPPFYTWCKVRESGLWDGIGIYFDTKPSVMFHTDFGRSHPTTWLRVDGRYVYESAGDEFWELLLENFSK